MSKHLRAEDSLRVLDFGPTSAGNINFVTGLGQSIYMANLVEDAQRADYQIASSESAGGTIFDKENFIRENLDFQGRTFDVVLLWDTLDYLPVEVVQSVADRLFEVIVPGGQLLALFHSTANATIKANPEDTVFSRYHLTETDLLELQSVGGRPLQQIYTNRQVEAIFNRYAGYKFFLAKDALREVIVTR